MLTSLYVFEVSLVLCQLPILCVFWAAVSAILVPCCTVLMLLFWSVYLCLFTNY